MEKGFHGANLRVMAQRAGLTTGAFYRYFADKNAIFEALVEPVTREFKQMIAESAAFQMNMLENNQVAEGWAVSEPNLFQLVDYMYTHFDEFDLLINCSTGSSLEGFMASILESDIVATQSYIDKMVQMGILGQSPPLRFIPIFIKHGYWSLLEIVVARMTYEEAQAYMKLLIPFLHAGWNTILRGGTEV